MAFRRRRKKTDEGWLLSYADLITNLLIFFVMIASATKLSTVRFQQIAQSMSGVDSPASLTSIAKEIDNRIEALQLKQLVRTQLTDAGLEISFNSGVVFDSGSAFIRKEYAPILDKILLEIVPYTSKYHVAIEGHTDEVPVSSKGPFSSNWELSSARALEVRLRLQELGVPRNRVRIEAYADTKTLPPEDVQGMSDSDRLARHRRVVVRVF